MTKSFLVRLISAIVVILLIFFSYKLFDVNALRALCFLCVVLGTRELIRMLYKKEESLFLKSTTALFVIIIFTVSAIYPQWSSIVFSILSMLFVSSSMMYSKRFEDLNSLSLFLSKSILSFFYLGLLPSFAFRLLSLDQGLIWFLGMLLVVFSGDTLAYIFGLLWGNKKMMPQISPKKTIIGSIGGLIGSGLSGLILCYALKSNSYIYFFLISLIIGLMAQLGDFFESLLKRVANIKDSGSIMPGHGGVLDRLDGVFFAAPLVFTFAVLFQNYFLLAKV